MPPVALLNLLSIGIVLLISATLLACRPANRKIAGIFLTALLLFVMLPIDDLALSIVSYAVRIRYDEYVFSLDRLFGSPSFVIGQLFISWPWLKNLSMYPYVLVPSVCLALAVLRYALLTMEEAVCCVRTIFISCLLAYPIYAVLPVAGPRYAFPSFPFAAPAHLTPRVVQLLAVPNGVPSVHMTLAILILWFSRPWVLGKVFGTIFVLLTVVATLGSGEHYLLDLLVAIPYSALTIYLGGYSAAAAKKGIAAEVALGVEVGTH